jgi:replicative DNA helicase
MKSEPKKTFDAISELGMIPPQCLDLEESVIGAMLIQPYCIDEVKLILPVEAFYRESNRIIADAIYQLHGSSWPIDVLTVTNELKRIGKLDIIGGPYYLTQLTSKVASSAHAEYHAKIVQEKYLQRELIRIGNDSQNLGFDETMDISDSLNQVQTDVNALQELLVGKKNRGLIDIISDSLNYLAKSKTQLFGLPTPSDRLNNLTNGWQNSDLIILAGRPSMGKTAFALANIRSACEAGKRMAIFSLEMTDVKLMNRLIASVACSDNISYEEAGGIISRWQLHIFEQGGVGLDFIIGNARLLARTCGLDGIVIDYLQLMRLPKADTKNDAIGQIMKGLKALAKELKIPVIVLCQLNRKSEERKGWRHEMSDIRDSGEIEQDADVIAFITRPVKRGYVEDENGMNIENMTVLQLAKQRDGAADVDIKLRNNSLVNYYTDWDTPDFSRPVRDYSVPGGEEAF